MGKVVSFFRAYKMLVVLIVMAAVMGAASPFFLTSANAINVLRQASSYGIIACGITFAIISGEFDLSVGSTMSLCGLVSILAEPAFGQIPAILLALLAGFAVGLLNGVLIAKAHINSFIVTIGSMGLVKGIALKISNGTPVISSNAWFGEIGNGAVAGIPNLAVFFIATALFSSCCLSRTRFGRNVYAVGGNKEVARNNGVDVEFHKTAAFVISSLTAAIAGVLLASRLNTGSALYGDNAALFVISGVVIGGTSLCGGVGNIPMSVIGIFIFTLITNSLDLLRVYSYYQTVIRGVLLMLIIGMDAFTRTRRER